MKKSLEEIRIARIVEEQFGVPFPDSEDKKEEEPKIDALFELRQIISRLELFWGNCGTSGPNQMTLEFGLPVLIEDLKSIETQLKKDRAGSSSPALLKNEEEGLIRMVGELSNGELLEEAILSVKHGRRLIRGSKNLKGSEDQDVLDAWFRYTELLLERYIKNAIKP